MGLPGWDSSRPYLRRFSLNCQGDPGQSRDDRGAADRIRRAPGPGDTHRRTGPPTMGPGPPWVRPQASCHALGWGLAIVSVERVRRCRQPVCVWHAQAGWQTVLGRRPESDGERPRGAPGLARGHDFREPDRPVCVRHAQAGAELRS